MILNHLRMGKLTKVEVVNFGCRLKELTDRPAAVEHARNYLAELQQVL